MDKQLNSTFRLRLTALLAILAVAAHSQALLEMTSGIGARASVGTVTYSGVHTGGYNGGSGATYNYSITVSGSHPVLVVHYASGSSNTVSSITWSLGSGTVSQAIGKTDTTGSGANVDIETWCIAAPHAGAGNVSVTMGVSTSSQVVDVDLFNNASQTTPCPTNSGDSAYTGGTSNNGSSLAPANLTAYDATAGNSAANIVSVNAMTPNSLYVNNVGATGMSSGYALGTAGITSSFTSTSFGDDTTAIRIKAFGE